MRRLFTTALALATLGAGLGWVQSQAADVFVSGNITVSETWTADNDYILTEVIYVTNGATLTIEPGTVIRGGGGGVSRRFSWTRSWRPADDLPPRAERAALRRRWAFPQSHLAAGPEEGTTSPRCRHRRSARYRSTCGYTPDESE